MELDKLSTADKLILGGGIAYLIFMFLPWYGISVSAGLVSFTYNANGWSFFLGGIIPLILVIVMCAHVIVTAFSPETTLPETPVPWGQIHLGAGIAAAVIVLLRLLIASDDYQGIDTNQNLDRKYGLFLAVIAIIVVAVGGFQKSKEPEAPTSAGEDTGGGGSPF